MGKERKREKKRNRERERGREGEEREGEEREGEEKEGEGEREKIGRERRNIIHTTNRGVCLRATDLTIFWLVSGVASGRKASDGLTRVEQIYEQNKTKSS